LAALAAAGGTDALERVLGMSGAPALLLAKDERGRTPLHAAALHGHTDAVALLLDVRFGLVRGFFRLFDRWYNLACSESCLLHFWESATMRATQRFILPCKESILRLPGCFLQRGSSMDATNKAGSSVWDVAALVGADAAKRIQDAAASFKAGNLRVSGKKSGVSACFCCVSSIGR
jgi:ankyrin repeat protein